MILRKLQPMNSPIKPGDETVDHQSSASDLTSESTSEVPDIIGVELILTGEAGGLDVQVE